MITLYTNEKSGPGPSAASGLPPAVHQKVAALFAQDPEMFRLLAQADNISPDAVFEACGQAMQGRNSRSRG